MFCMRTEPRIFDGELNPRSPSAKWLSLAQDALQQLFGQYDIDERQRLRRPVPNPCFGIAGRNGDVAALDAVHAMQYGLHLFENSRSK